MDGNMTSVKIDFSEAFNGLDRLSVAAVQAGGVAITKVANEALRLSTFEVPHDTGALQTSGTSRQTGILSAIAGYNKEYAARLHEHPEYRFQKGRKGKYLEDPIKRNLPIFLKFFGNSIKGDL